MDTERTASILGGVSSNSISLVSFLSSRERVIVTEVSTQAFDTKRKNTLKYSNNFTKMNQTELYGEGYRAVQLIEI